MFGLAGDMTHGAGENLATSLRECEIGQSNTLYRCSATSRSNELNTLLLSLLEVVVTAVECVSQKLFGARPSSLVALIAGSRALASFSWAASTVTCVIRDRGLFSDS